MNYCFFTNTPAHVHLYKHAVDALRDQGHDVLVLGREYTCTVDLLEYYDLPYEVFGRLGTTKGSLVTQLPRHYVTAFQLVRRFDPDLLIGMGGYAAHTGALTGTKTILLTDSEPAWVDQAISKPFAAAILTPNTFRKDLGDSHYVYDGVQECAYLHPETFERDPSVRAELGVDPTEPFAILRLNAFGSQHDVGKRGIDATARRQIVERLAREMTVLVSDEGGDADLEGLPAEPFSLHPARMHDALAEASVLVADTQTMVTEAALLGTPAVRSNSFVGDDDMGNFLALEQAGLIRNVGPGEDLLGAIESVLEVEETTWTQRRDQFINETVNLTDVLVEVALSGGEVAAVDAVRQFGAPARHHSTGVVPTGGD